MPLIDNLNKALSRSWLERGLFVEAFVLLGIMRTAIQLFPFQRISKFLGLVQGLSAQIEDSPQPTLPANIGWAIQAASQRTPWESACLAQALSGTVMLTRRGLNAILYLGVAKDLNCVGSLAAHAWLRSGDAIICGANGVERFSEISSFSRPTVRKLIQKQNQGGQTSG